MGRFPKNIGMGHRWSFSAFLSLFPGPCWKHIINNEITPLNPKFLCSKFHEITAVRRNTGIFSQPLSQKLHYRFHDLPSSHVNTRVLGHKKNAKLLYFYFLVNFALFSMILHFLFYLHHHRTDKLHLPWCEKDNEWLFTEMSSNSGVGLIGIKN